MCCNWLFDLCKSKSKSNDRTNTNSPDSDPDIANCNTPPVNDAFGMATGATTVTTTGAATAGSTGGPSLSPNPSALSRPAVGVVAATASAAAAATNVTLTTPAALEATVASVVPALPLATLNPKPPRVLSTTVSVMAVLKTAAYSGELQENAGVQLGHTRPLSTNPTASPMPGNTALVSTASGSVPTGDTPVTVLSLLTHNDLTYHLTLGQALASPNSTASSTASSMSASVTPSSLGMPTDWDTSRILSRSLDISLPGSGSSSVRISPPLHVNTERGRGGGVQTLYVATRRQTLPHLLTGTATTGSPATGGPSVGITPKTPIGVIVTAEAEESIHVFASPQSPTARAASIFQRPNPPSAVHGAARVSPTPPNPLSLGRGSPLAKSARGNAAPGANPLSKPENGAGGSNTSPPKPQPAPPNAAAVVPFLLAYNERRGALPPLSSSPRAPLPALALPLTDSLPALNNSSPLTDMARAPDVPPSPAASATSGISVMLSGGSRYKPSAKPSAVDS